MALLALNGALYASDRSDRIAALRVQLRNTTATQAIELNDQWAVTGAITLVGDFQYLWRVNGLPSPGAAVFGVQANVTF